IMSDLAALPVIQINELPEDVLLIILQKIFAPKDVANLNEVSKSVYKLNQHPGIADARIIALYKNTVNEFIFENCGISIPSSSYEHYTRAYNLTLSSLPRMFYASLPLDMKNELKHRIWHMN